MKFKSYVSLTTDTNNVTLTSYLFGVESFYNKRTNAWTVYTGYASKFA